MIRKRLGFIGAILGIVVAFIGAYQMIDKIRIVDIITLFFGGFGAGAGLIKVIMDHRKEKNRD
ncbi:MAG: hypothetical protein ABR936_02745 [Bacteroidota bacterium]